MALLAAIFEAGSKETAIVYLAAVGCFALAALAAPMSSRFPGGALALIALGLGLWLLPLMWTSFNTAF